MHFGNVLIVLTRIASVENPSPLSGLSSQKVKRKEQKRDHQVEQLTTLPLAWKMHAVR